MSILQGLQQCMTDFPESLRLYSTSSDTRIYRRDVYELHINYFVSIIIFFHLCGPAIRYPAACLASLVASSCIASLYEEMDYRDDLNYLFSINNWYLMVACVPQLHYSGSVYNTDNMCSAELDILVAALRQTSIKWPGANMILSTVARLRGASDGTAQPPLASTTSATEGRRDHLSMAGLNSLFPFPSDMCPRMSLLEEDLEERPELALGAMTPPNIEDWDWIFDEFTDLGHGMRSVLD